jgi:hypothetical protein
VNAPVPYEVSVVDYNGREITVHRFATFEEMLPKARELKAELDAKPGNYTVCCTNHDRADIVDSDDGGRPGWNDGLTSEERDRLDEAGVD